MPSKRKLESDDASEPSSIPAPLRKSSKQVKPKKEFSHKEPKATELPVRRSRRKVKAEEVAGVSNGGDEATPEDSVDSEKGEEIATTENGGEVMDENGVGEVAVELAPRMKPVRSRKKTSVAVEDPESRFLGNPVPVAEAKKRWPERYGIVPKKEEPSLYNRSLDDEEVTTYQARCHYTEAEIDGSVIFNLYDDAYVQAPEGEDNYICKIVEMFQAINGTLYFTAQWFYRAKDTVIQIHGDLIHPQRVFFSEIRNVNTLDCLVQKLKIVRFPLTINSEMENVAIPNCDYFYDMLYLVPYSTYKKIPPDHLGARSCPFSKISSDANNREVYNVKSDSFSSPSKKSELFLLDLYSGCGAMSTGLCLGAKIAGVNLVTRWAVDLNQFACQSLRANHPETEVRNEAANDFLLLLKEWKKLCICFSLISGTIDEKYAHFSYEEEEEDHDDDDKASSDENDSEVFEVEKVIAICYGDPKENNKPGLYLKVKWKGYGKDYDTWEPIEGLSNCGESIKSFVVNGYKSKILPLPGDVDVVCGGPPCQGVSGFNRFRDDENPLNDPKNEQLVVFMDIVEYLKPRFALMENVCDLMKFCNGFLGKYALGRLLKMNYQTRMGMMVAGSYGLPQYRMRVFMWGAHPNEILPQYPLPTHDVVGRGVCPIKYEMNYVTYNKDYKVQLKQKLFLEDAISDLPEVKNDEHRDELTYNNPPLTEFQKFIRSRIEGSSDKEVLYDHRPLQLNCDDFQRVCQIPKRKGACFRDLPGVRVDQSNNTVFFDPDMPRVFLSSGKPLVPDYAMTFVKGTSSKPFKRLWWDETVATVVTRAEPHNQQILHPLQDRVLTIRENARLQGFPDYYKLYGPVKERYIQVGNAVAVPVARALGYSLALSCTGSSNEEPVFLLPKKFP